MCDEKLKKHLKEKQISSNNIKTDETMAKEIIESFKKMFEAMSYEEREEYLKKHGFDFGTPDDEKSL